MIVVKKLGSKDLFSLKRGDMFTLYENDYKIKKKTKDQISAHKLECEDDIKVFSILQNLIVQQIIYKNL
jgi:hypothetical protein